MGLIAHTDYSLRLLVCLALRPETSATVSESGRRQRAVTALLGDGVADHKFTGM